MDPYSAGVLGHSVPTEQDRLRTLQAMLDPATFALLERVHPQPGWRCLEFGGGAGSVARWLAARCPIGPVLATDVDTRFLDAMPEPNLTVLRHDAAADDFEECSFDLVHARLLLHHLPGREEVLARAVRWLVPGGWLVLEEPDFTCVDASPYPALSTLYSAFEAFMRDRQGTDYRWARRLGALVAGLGLEAVDTTVTAYHTGTGSGREFWHASMEQSVPSLVSSGRLDAADAAAGLAALADPEVLDQLFTVVAAWGRRPSEPTAA